MGESINKKGLVYRTKKLAQNGFTMIELITIMFVIGLIMLIAVPAVNRYLLSSKKNTYVATVKSYINMVRGDVTARNYVFRSPNTVYYVPVECIDLESGGPSPFGEWENAYVVVTFDGTEHQYYWTAYDSGNMGVSLASEKEINASFIVPGKVDMNFNIPIGDRDKVGIIDKKTCEFEVPPVVVAEESYDEYYASLSKLDVRCVKMSGSVIEQVYVKTNNDWSFGESCNYNGTVVFPDYVDGVKVTGIGGSFISTSSNIKTEAKKIVLPPGITVINNDAFKSFVNLESIEIPPNVKKIGTWAFQGTKLKEIIFHEGLEEIGERAFADLANPVSIEELVLPNSLIKIGAHAFHQGTGRSSQTVIKKLVIGDSITSIGVSAFYECGIETLVIGSNVKTIEAGAFGFNNLTTLVIPNSVEIIEGTAFQKNKINDLTLGNKVREIKGSAFEYNQLSTLIIPSSTLIVGPGSFGNNPIVNYTIKYNATNVKTRLDSQLDSSMLGKTKAIYVEE